MGNLNYWKLERGFLKATAQTDWPDFEIESLEVPIARANSLDFKS